MSADGAGMPADGPAQRLARSRRAILQDIAGRQPARDAAALARPALARWGRQRPALYLGLAAAVGGALLLLRPWKLVSLTGLLLALIRRPSLLGLALGVLTRGRNPAGDALPRRH